MGVSTPPKAIRYSPGHGGAAQITPPNPIRAADKSSPRTGIPERSIPVIGEGHGPCEPSGGPTVYDCAVRVV